MKNEQNWKYCSASRQRKDIVLGTPIYGLTMLSNANAEQLLITIYVNWADVLFFFVAIDPVYADLTLCGAA